MRGPGRRLLVAVGVCVCASWAHAAPQRPDFGAEPHRLRPAPARDRRPQRMASANPDEHPISFGCIVVPVEFYAQVIDPTFGSRCGVVYVLPEASPVQAMFGTLEARLEID